MFQCECGNRLGETEGDFKAVRHPCLCLEPGDERNPSPRVGLPSFISKTHYDERKRMGMPLVLPAERKLL